tara:strand:- start:421 stop:975 length:555 start_codon:yes stop_codon:yes gene_type:complete
MQKAVFLDRDGVINEEVNFLIELEKIALIEGSAEALRNLNNAGYSVIIITNQPAVGRGLATESQITAINNRIVELLGEQGAKIDATYMCFHHPKHGQGKYKVDCGCRKPKPGMILEAAKDHNIDLSQSFMVGDRTSDIKAGVLSGAKTISVRTGYGGAGNDGFNDATHDYIADNLLEASKIILQ